MVLGMLAMMSVYPRVGGGNRGSLVSNAEMLGLSPRGRGKLISEVWTQSR